MEEERFSKIDRMEEEAFEYEKVMGRRPTPEELEEAEEY